MKRAITNVVIVVLAVFIIVTGVYNWKCNEEFLSATITQVLTLALTLGVAFWATQYKTDLRKMKEQAEKIIEKIQDLVSDPQFFSISASGDKESIQKQINSRNRKINNCITILTEYAKFLKFKNELEYIRREFEGYKNRVGEHINDLDYLARSENEFKRNAENIDTKCDYIVLMLYK